MSRSNGALLPFVVRQNVVLTLLGSPESWQHENATLQPSIDRFRGAKRAIQLRDCSLIVQYCNASIPRKRLAGDAEHSDRKSPDAHVTASDTDGDVLNFSSDFNVMTTAPSHQHPTLQVYCASLVTVICTLG